MPGTGLIAIGFYAPLGSVPRQILFRMGQYRNKHKICALVRKFMESQVLLKHFIHFPSFFHFHFMGPYWVIVDLKGDPFGP